jgi:hypothetical protein
MTEFTAILGSLFVLYLVLAIYSRPSLAIGIVLPLSWLFPCWTFYDAGIDRLSLKAALAIGMLCSYPFFPRAKFPWKLVPCDYAVLSLIAVGLISDIINDGWSLYLPVMAYVEWILPYLAGRLAFQEREDIEWAWPVLACVAIVLGVVSVIEAWSGVNPYELVFGLRPLDGANREAVRWGFRRAYAVCCHPLYQGVFLSWLFCWLVLPAWGALDRRSPIFWFLPAAFGFVAPLATGSRGPFMANGLVLVVCLFFYAKRWRKAFAAALGVVILALVIFQDKVFVFLDDWSGEFDRGRQAQSVSFDGDQEKVSSARARLTLFKIYWAPLTRAGLLGFGSESVSTFPVNVPIGSEEADAARAIWSLDNTYLLMTLRFGYLGLLCFVAIIVAALWQLLAVYDAEPNRTRSQFAATLAAGTFAVAWLIFGVWTPADFGFAWLWGIGAASGLYFQVFRRKTIKPGMPT